MTYDMAISLISQTYAVRMTCIEDILIIQTMPFSYVIKPKPSRRVSRSCRGGKLHGRRRAPAHQSARGVQAGKGAGAGAGRTAIGTTAKGCRTDARGRDAGRLRAADLSTGRRRGGG